MELLVTPLRHHLLRRYALRVLLLNDQHSYSLLFVSGAVHTTPEKSENATITSHLRFAFEICI